MEKESFITFLFYKAFYTNIIEKKEFYMKIYIKKLFVALICIILAFTNTSISIFASGNDDSGTNSEADSIITDVDLLEISAKSCVLMEMSTGQVIYAKSPSTSYSPASVTKVMTLLLIAEAIENGRISADDKVLISAEAASMGGSQIFLKEGEEFTVEELIKCTVIASANDCAVALAEHLYESEKAFVKQMNKRAEELRLNNTYFENCTGLDDETTDHKSSAYDIAIMSRELMKYDLITKYSCVWQDSIRDGEFILTNTNRLVRYYKGCTGLKTGSTDKAGFCVTVTASRDGMDLIAVIMGAESRDIRNKEAKELLDFGFSSYTLYSDPPAALETVPVKFGKRMQTEIYSSGFTALIDKTRGKEINKVYEIPEYVCAPLKDGDVIGKIIYRDPERIIGEASIIVRENIDKTGLFDIFYKMMKFFVGIKY